MPAIQSISKYSDLELALMGFLGWIGNGQDRVNLLGSRYGKVQGMIDNIINTDTVPAGTGSSSDYDPAAIKKAVHAAFDEIIDQVCTEVIDELK
jgi:hypothetical protein